MTEVIAKTEALPVAEQTNGLMRMIEQVCMNPEMDVNKLEKMLDMQERVLDRQSEQQFQIDMAQMQAELPVVERSGAIEVKGVVRSKYARFEDINKAALPIMQKYGFSITFETQQAAEYINIIGVLRHKSGHKQSTQLQIPYDDSGSKNKVQAVGSSVSYGKRYVMTALLNITTAGDDDDGQTAVPSMDLRAHNFAMQANLDNIFAIKTFLANGDTKKAVRIWVEDISSDDKKALWVAPTDGGVFRTEERAALQKTSVLRDKQSN